jgi:hypothetical protein
MTCHFPCDRLPAEHGLVYGRRAALELLGGNPVARTPDPGEPRPASSSWRHFLPARERHQLDGTLFTRIPGGLTE